MFRILFSDENHNLLNRLIVMLDDDFNLVFPLILSAICYDIINTSILKPKSKSKVMSIQSKGFDWDEGNQMKCQKHGLSLEEIEDFFKRRIFITPDVKHSQVEQRFLAVGHSSSGKPMFVAFTLRNNLIRPISARFMHEKEAKKYEKTLTQDDK